MDFSCIDEIKTGWKAMEMLGASITTERYNYVTQLEVYLARINSAFDILKKRYKRALASKTGDPGNAGSVEVDDTDPASRGNDPDHKESSDSNANIQSHRDVDNLCEKIKESMKHSGKDVSSSHTDGLQNATEDVIIVSLKAILYLIALKEPLLKIISEEIDETSVENRTYLETLKEAKAFMEKHQKGQDLPAAESASWAMDVRQIQINLRKKLHKFHLLHLEKENQLVKIQQEDWLFMGDLTKVFQSLAETYTSKVEPTAEPPIDELTAESTPEHTPRPTADPRADSTADSTVDPTADSTADPTADSTAEPTAESTPDNTSKPTAEPKADPTADSTADSTANPTADSTADSTADPSADSTADLKADPTPQPSAQPTA